MKKTPCFTLPALLSFTVILSACQPIITARGNMVPEDRLQRIEVGRSDKDDVIRILGNPTVTPTFAGDDVWYYVGQQTERIGFGDPEVTERRTVAVTFDQRGTVSEIEDIPLEEGRNVETVDRATPTGGRKLGFFEQIFGNFGKF